MRPGRPRYSQCVTAAGDGTRSVPITLASGEGFFERPLHGLHIGLLAGPHVEADGALVDEHGEAGEGFVAAAAGFLDEGGFGGIGDGVADEEVAAGFGEVDGRHEVDVGEEADGSGVDEDVDVGADGVVARPGDEFGVGFGAGGEVSDHGAAAVGVAVDDGDFPGTSEGKFYGDGAGCARRLEDDDAFAAGIEMGLFAHAAEESALPSVFSPMSLPPSMRTVLTAPMMRASGMISSRSGMTAIFVGDGEVDAAEAHGAEAADGLGEGFRGGLRW